MTSKDSKDKSDDVAATYFLDSSNNLSVILTNSADAFEADVLNFNSSEQHQTTQQLDSKKSTGLVDEKWISVCQEQKIIKTRLNAHKDAEQNELVQDYFLSLFESKQREPLLAILDLARLFPINNDNQFSPVDIKLGAETRFILNGINHLFAAIKSKIFPETTRQWNKIEAVLCNDLYNEIKDSIESIRPFCTRKKISLDNRIKPGITQSLFTEEAKFQPIFQNVLFNAIQCSIFGETIGIAYKNLTSSHLHIQISGAGTPCAATIAGSKEFLQQPFNKINLNTYMLEGSGIGLIIASKLIEFLGGGFSINFRQDVGNIFDIILPVTEKHILAQQAEEEAGKSSSAGTSKVLYIEDNESHIQLIANILGKYRDINFHSALNAEQGLEMALQHRPNLIILDIRLNGMDGYEVLKRLRADERTSDIPVIALSAAAMNHEVQRGLSLGFDHYLTKPFHIADFTKLLQKELPDSSVSKEQYL